MIKRKNKAATVTTPAKKVRKSKRLSEDVYEKMEVDFAEKKNENKSALLKELPIETLNPSQMIRTINEKNVQELVSKMERKIWKHSLNKFVVVQTGESDAFYEVLDGNHRLAAIKKYNEKAIDKVPTVQCVILSADDPEKIFKAISVQNDMRVLPFTILQQANILHEIKKITPEFLPPTTDTKNERAFLKFAKTVMGCDVNNVVPEFMRLNTNEWKKIKEIQIENEKLFSSWSTASFWRAFFCGYKNDKTEAIEYLKNMDPTQPKDTKTKLKKLEKSLLNYLIEKVGAKEIPWGTSNDAALGLGAPFGTPPNDVRTILENEKWALRRNNRSKFNWKTLRKNVTDAFYKKQQTNPDIKCRNLEYSNTEWKDYKNADFIVVQRPSKNYMNSLKEGAKNAVIIVIDDEYHENCVFEMRIIKDERFQQQSISDQINNYFVAKLLISTMTADNELQKHVTLNELCNDKGFKIQKILTLETFSKLALIAKNFNNAALLNVDKTVAESFLDEMGNYKTITLVGNDAMNQLYKKKLGCSTETAKGKTSKRHKTTANTSQEE